MIPMPAKKKKSKRTFGKGGKKPTINNPDTHHGTYDLPNASVRSYSEKAKPMKFSKGGEVSQEDIDKMSYGEAFKHFRGKGAGTKFTWRGSKQAAYRKGEEPESWKRNEARKKEAEAPKPAPKAEAPKPAPKAEAPKPAPKAEAPKPAPKAEAPKPAPKTSSAANYVASGFAGDPVMNTIVGKPRKVFAKGGSVESKSMMKKEIGFMKKKGAPKSMIKHEMAEAKGMKSGGMACGGMKKYARGGGVESHGKTKGTMIKMASGGSVSARADGVASKGKTNCKIC